MDVAKPSSNKNPNSKISMDPNRKDILNTSASNPGYEYVPTLKTVGYVIGQPVSVPSRDNNRPTTPKLAQGVSNGTSRVTTSRMNSRIVYGPDVIVHEHPSRPVRSPSPITTNPNSNIIPHTNFIYNSSGQSVQTVTVNSPPPPRVVSYSPAKTAVTTTVVQQAIPMPTVVSVPVSPKINTSNMVPRAQYQRCVTQCKTWEQRYNELYAIYMQLNNQKINRSISDNANKMLGNQQNMSGINSQQYDIAIKQNRKLKERVRELQKNQQRLTSNMEDIITKLVNKYRDSTLKQCMLLADRYRLEKKMNQKM